MISHDIQAMLDTAEALLADARTCFEASKYDESERCAQQVLDLLEPHAERNDVGSARDASSQLYAIINSIAHAYNRLVTINVPRSNYELALRQAETGLRYSERIGNDLRTAHLISNIGIIYTNLGLLDKALEFSAQAQHRYENLENHQQVALVTLRTANILRQLGSYDKALEYLTIALATLQEIGDKADIGHVLVSLGVLDGTRGNYPEALEYFSRALAIYQELGNQSAIAQGIGNSGWIYRHLGIYDKALECFHRALAMHSELGEKSSISSALGNIGELYAIREFEGYDVHKAEEYLLKALRLSEEIGSKTDANEFHQFLSNLYRQQKRWEEADTHFQKFYVLEKEIQNEEAKKHAEKREMERREAEKEREIAIAQAAAAAKHSSTTALLHRVLPESIATRMIAGENDISDYFSSVTILFADIVGFTPISAGMPAHVVVRFLNYVFGIFDTIMKKHGCEKIKTIGDGYMAVAGAPIPCDDHAQRIAFAALEMQQDIKLPDEFREYLPEGVTFGIRIGLHTGSVVGGVIGDERFVYDIYSDAVNTAARMESHGEAGKIHVSEEFKHAVETLHATSLQLHATSLQFIRRGELDIKGKGIMNTYFLEKS